MKPTNSLHGGERKLMNHFVVKNVFALPWTDPAEERGRLKTNPDRIRVAEMLLTKKKRVRLTQEVKAAG